MKKKTLVLLITFIGLFFGYKYYRYGKHLDFIVKNKRDLSILNWVISVELSKTNGVPNLTKEEIIPYLTESVSFSKKNYTIVAKKNRLLIYLNGYDEVYNLHKNTINIIRWNDDLLSDFDFLNFLLKGDPDFLFYDSDDVVTVWSSHYYK